MPQVLWAKAFPFSSSAPSYTFNLPTNSAAPDGIPGGIPAGARLVVFAATASSTRTFTPPATPALVAPPDPFPASVETSGHESWMWTAPVGTSDTGDPVAFTQGGGNLKCLFLAMIVKEADSSDPFDVVLASVQSTSVSSHVAPAGTAPSAGGLEIQVAFDSRGGSLPNTTVWTPPAAMTQNRQTTLTGTVSFSSGVIGWNTTTLAGGAAVGGDTWTADQSAISSAWTVVFKAAAGASESPVADAGEDQANIEPGQKVYVDGRATTDPDTSFGSLTLVPNQTGSPTVAVVEEEQGLWSYIAPYSQLPVTKTWTVTATDGDGNSNTSPPRTHSILAHNEWGGVGSGARYPRQEFMRRVVQPDTPEALIFADTFSRADTATGLGSSPTHNNPWLNSGTFFRILGNAAAEAGAGSGRVYTAVECYNTDVRIEANITTSATTDTTDVGVTFRSVKTFTSTEKRLYIRVRKIAGPTNSITILSQGAAGSDTTLATNTSAGLADNTTYNLTVIALGNQISVYLDDVLKVSYTLTGSEDLPGSAVGLTYNVTNDGGSKVNSFEVYHSGTKPIIPATIIAHRASLSRYGDEAEEKVATLADLFADAPGLNAVEIDVRKTSNAGYVLCHDDTVDRTTSGTGLVSSLTTAACQALGMPTLAEMLTALETYTRLPYNLSMIIVQGYVADADLDDVAVILNASPLKDRIVFTPSTVAGLDNVRANWPVPKRISLYGIDSTTYTTSIPTAVAQQTWLAFIAPNDSVYITNRAYVTNIHAAGMKAGASTVNGSDAVRAAISDGIDAILTDVADQLLYAYDPNGGVWV